MKKIITITAFVFLIIILFMPLTSHLDDGGTVVYKAIVYQVDIVHRMTPKNLTEDGLLEGTVVKILGIEIYNSVK